MAEKGLRLDFTVIRDPADVEEAIREFGRLESKGWKAKEGTAVSVDNAQGRFYQAVLEDFCARGEGVIYQLRIDGQVVATDICVVTRRNAGSSQDGVRRRSERLFAGISASRRHRSGPLLRVDRFEAIEFYGPLMEYQLRWTRDIRTLYHLTCFRHRWVRSARNLVKRIRTHQPAAACLQRQQELD